MAANSSSDANTHIYTFIPSFSDGQVIRSKLADRFKDGSIMIDEGDGWRYLSFYLVVVVFFYINYHAWWQLLDRCKVK